LELYGLSGHLTSMVENAIASIAELRVLPDESDSHVFTVDDLMDAYLQLHAINYGSGRTPAAPLSDFDRSKMWAWASSLKNQFKPDVAKREPAETRNNKVSTYDNSELLETPEIRMNASLLGKEIRNIVSRPAELSQDLTEKKTPGLTSTTLDSHGKDLGQVEPLGFWRYASERTREHDKDARKTTPKGENTIRTREIYPSDVTDAEWFQLEPLIPTVKSGGRPGKYDRREILNGMLHHELTECSWRKLPKDLPPWRIAYHYYREWSTDGTWAIVLESLAGYRGRSDTRLRHDKLAGWLDFKTKTSTS